MTSLYEFLSSNIATDLAQSLLHSLWQALIIALLLLVALKGISGSHSRWRYRLALLSIGAVVLSWVGTFSILRHEASPSIAPARQQNRSVQSSIQTEAAIETPTPARQTIDSTAVQTIPTIPAASPKTKGLGYGWLIPVWFVGVILMTARIFIAMAGASRHKRNAAPIEDPALVTLLKNLCERMDVKRRIQFAATHTLNHPSVIGFWKPMLLIPASMLTGTPLSDLEAIIAHELAHVRRHDYLINLGQMIIESIFFFNPAVWWISRQIRIEREACCDLLGIDATGRRIEYAKVLVDEFSRTSSIPLSEQPATAMGFGNDNKSSTERIRRIIHPRQKPAMKIGSVRLAFLIGIAALSIAALSKTADLTVEVAAKILTPKERIEKLHELYNRDQPEDDSSRVFTRTFDKITVSGRFIFPEGDVPPDRLDYMIMSAGGRFGGRAKKDLSFSCEVANRPGIRVGAYVQGYAPFLSEAFHPNRQDIDGVRIKMTPGFSSSIQVLDHEETPLSGLGINWLYAVERDGGGWSGLGRSIKKITDSNGMVTIEDCSEHPVRISIAAKGYQPLENKLFTISKDRPLVITLKKGLTQKIEVTSQKTGQPVAGAEVILRLKKKASRHMSYGPEEPLWGTTDKTGMLELNNLEDNTAYGITIKATGYNPLMIDDFSATNQTTNISLADETVLQGIITGNLSRIEKTYVDGKYQSAMSYSSSGNNNGVRRALQGEWIPVKIKDGVGHFELRGFIGDEVTLRPKGTKKEVHLKVEPSTRKEISFSIDDDLTIWAGDSRIVEFTFNTPEGLPLASGNCAASYQTKMEKDNGHNSWRTMKFSVSNGVGRASFPAPGYVRLADAQELVGYWLEPESYEDAQERLIEPGAAPFKLSYTLKNSSGGIFGKLLTSNGEPMGSMFMNIVPIIPIPPYHEELTAEEIQQRSEAFEERSELSRVISNHGKRSSNGAFSYPSLPLNHAYKIIARSTRYTFLVSEPVPLTEQNPIQEITLQCNPLQSISGKLLMPDGSPSPNTRVKFECSVMEDGEPCHSFGVGGENTDASGHFVFEGINPHPDLDYQLSIDPGDGWQPICEKITPGAELTYTLEKGQFFEGRVIDQETGLPVSGVNVGMSKLSNTTRPVGAGAQTDSEGYFSVSTLSSEAYALGIYTQTNRYEIISPATTNGYLEITGGVDEYIELRVKPMTNFPHFTP